MTTHEGIFAGFTGAGAGALVALQWILYFLPLIGAMFWFIYWSKHKYPVSILDLSQDSTGKGIGVREMKDKGGVFRKAGIPYFHLMKRFKVKYLRPPMGHEIESDGRVYLLRLSEKSYRYAPRKVMIRKNGDVVMNTEEQLYDSIFSEKKKHNKNQILMIANPTYDPKRPVGNPHNKQFLKVEEDENLVDFDEGEIRHNIDESHTDAFSENVKSITESVYNNKDWRPAVVWLGGFATLAIMFIFLVIFSGKI